MAYTEVLYGFSISGRAIVEATRNKDKEDRDLLMEALFSGIYDNASSNVKVIMPNQSMDLEETLVYIGVPCQRYACVTSDDSAEFITHFVDVLASKSENVQTDMTAIQDFLCINFNIDLEYAEPKFFIVTSFDY